VEAVVERVGRLADGWFPQFPPNAEGRATLERMRGYARAAGRDPASISVEGRISLADSSPDDWPRLAEDWSALGATHLSVNTMRAGLKTPAAHIDAIQRFYKTVHG
jgi:alkanesulfonate monooxygenase SsuD/methylene tetrahydromethanopterin reductase-like flavin-dependent oxidoreductase (luciferase family)